MRFANVASMTAVLLATWFLWSGHAKALLAAFGVGSTIFVVALLARMKILDEEGRLLALGWRQIAYLPWLVWEIAKANVAVARLIVAPRLTLHPKLIRVRPSQHHTVARVIYANSITLTPGTITLDVRDGQLLVHALTNDAAYALAQGFMDRRVTRIEGRRPHRQEPDV